jgi:ABC-type proline/glycine betaine transport system substrate-binding protein
MKKTLLYISTGFVGITLIATLAGKITFEQFGYITPAVLGIVYGIYQRVINGEKDETIGSLRTALSESYNEAEKTEAVLNAEISQLKNQVDAYAMTSRNLRAGFDSEKQVETTNVVEKPKRKRKEK